ncbi:MAG: recombinase family protein [Syntrophales bacterium]|nr:recombinase family protein [Syntrophales bacterium]
MAIITAIYIRVSTEEQAEKGFSVENQIEKLSHTAEEQGWQHEIFDDRGYSGAKFDRPELQRMLKLVKNKQIERVLVWKVDRLSRKLSHLLNILELLEANNVELISVSENFDIKTPVGKLLLGMLGTVAEFERDSIIQRIKAITNTRKRIKKLPLGNPPYGLVINETKSMLVQDNGPGCELVKKIFNLAGRGMGTTRIAEYLNNNGFKTRREKRFSSAVVGRMLNNITYAGMIEIDGELVRGNIEPIISLDTYMKMQGALQRRKHQIKAPGTKHLLTGLLKCSICGSGLVSSGYYALGKRFYRCARKANEGRSACTLKAFNAKRLEADIEAKLSEIVAKDKNLILQRMIKEEEKYILMAQETKQDIRRLESSIKGDEDSVNKYFEMFETDFISQEDLGKRIDLLKKNTKAQRNELFTLKASLLDLNPTEIRKRLEAALNSFQLVFELADEWEQRNLLRIIIDRIDAYNDHLDVFLKSGYCFKIKYEREIKRFTRILRNWEINTLKEIGNKRARAIIMASEGVRSIEIAHVLNVDFNKIITTIRMVNRRGIGVCFNEFRDNQDTPFESFLRQNITTFRYLSFRKIMKKLEDEGFSPSLNQFKNAWYRIVPDDPVGGLKKEKINS